MAYPSEVGGALHDADGIHEGFSHDNRDIRTRIIFSQLGKFTEI